MKWGFFLAAMFLAGSLVFVSCSNKPNAPQKVSFDWDKGPVDVDVVKYPKDLQETYNSVFKAKCSACHSLARALWAPYYDEALWNKIVSKMANRPGSQVTLDDVPKITKLLVYDHTQRKDQIEKKFTEERWAKKDPIGL